MSKSSGPSKPFTIKHFDVAEANWVDDATELVRIRREVFIKGQNVPEEIEWDGRDETAHHWIARNPDSIAIGTGRLLPDGHLGRMAVLEDYRGQGIGSTILELAVQKALRLGLKEVVLHAQSYVQAFYQKAGFEVRGEEFIEAGIVHIEMRLKLGKEDIHAAGSISFVETFNVTLTQE